MLNKESIDKRIRRITEHGDNAQDVRDLAALLYVKRHMDEGKEHSGRHAGMTREQAETWVRGMRGEDPSVPHGGKWTAEQIKPIAQRYGVPTEGERFWAFYAVINAMYSDYFAVAKKYNTMSPDFFADLAMAFISDKDAVDDKAAEYYRRIVAG